MALVQRTASHWVPAGTDSCDAGIDLRAKVLVIAPCSVCGRRVGAQTGRGVADACEVALIEGRTGGEIGPNAHACLARVRLGAEIAIVTRCTIGELRVGAEAGRASTCPDGMARVEGDTDHRICPDAGARLAGVALCTSIAVVARAAVGLGWIRAHTGYRATDADVVALVEGRAGYRVGAGADPRPTGVRLRAEVFVIARCSVCRGRVGAQAGGGVAGASVVALVDRSADDRICPDTGTCLAGVTLCAPIAVIARRPIGCHWIGAEAGRRVAHACRMAVIEGGANDRVCASASSSLTGIGKRAEVAVIAQCSVGCRWIGTEPGRRIAQAGKVTLIEGGADDGIGAGADSRLTGVGERAEVGIVARCSIGRRWVGTETGRGIADAGKVTLVEGGADDGIRAATEAFLARVDSRAEISVIAGGVFGHLRVGADPGRGITDADVVALIECRADYRIGPCAGTGLAGVGLGAEAGVVARCSVGCLRVRADARRAVAHAGNVTLVESRADHRTRADADTSRAGVHCRTEITIIARRPAGLGRIGAKARGAIAHAGVVALVEGSADDRVGAGADAS